MTLILIPLTNVVYLMYIWTGINPWILYYICFLTRLITKEMQDKEL